jgi:hypothetical protein
MIFTRSDRRLMTFALVFAVPVEIGLLRFFSHIPFDFEPAVKPGRFELWTGMAAVIIHYPAIPILMTKWSGTPRMWLVLFLTGYIDLLLAFAIVFAVYRLLKLVASHI